jgi:tRNA-modifying protein YgfZ
MWLAPCAGALIYGEIMVKVEGWMTAMLCLLQDRGVIEVKGVDATNFLQRLVTNSVLNIAQGESRYAALLTAQGKLMFDFFIVPLPDEASGYLIDCLKHQVGDLVKRLNLHKLRANLTIADKLGECDVAAVFGGNPPEGIDGLVYRDMRTPGMGWRVIAKHGSLQSMASAGEEAYEAHRIAQGVPKGGADFAYGDTFVHEANLDLLHGIDFKKGCYVGQEVVARVEFRKSARKRIVKINFDGPAPVPGTEIVAGEAAIGQVGSTAAGEGLAMVRIDRLEEARAAGESIKAGQASVGLTVPPEFVAAAAGVEKRL